MKLYNKLLVVLCIALAMCLAAPALLPAGLNAAISAQAASAIKLNKTKATLYNGKTLTLKVSGTSKAVTWSTSNGAVATVSKKGVVTAKKVGKADITAKVGGKTLVCAVTVKAPLSADATNITLKVGQTKKVTLTWQLTGKVSLKKYDTSVLSCKLGGSWKDKKNTLTIKGVRAGTQTLTLKNSKTSDVVRIKVTVKGSGDEGQIVDKTSLTISKGKSAKINVTWPYSELPYMMYDNYAVSFTWGKWNGKGWPATITGLEKGETVLSIFKGQGGELLAEIKVKVK